MKLVISAIMLFASVSDAAIVGLENLPRGGDKDYNDVQLTTSGLTFHLAGDFVFVAPPGYLEVPFPSGYLFDYATVTGSGAVTFLSHQSAYDDVALVRIGSGAWLDVPTSGSLAIIAPVGTVVLFGVRSPGHESFYSDPTLNSDGQYHAVVTGVPGDEVPEPAYDGVLGLCFIGAYVVLAWAKRRGM